MLVPYQKINEKPKFENVFKNNMLEDIAKMTKEEWKDRLKLQRFYVNYIRHKEQKQQAEHYKNSTGIDLFVDSFSIINEFVNFDSMPYNKYNIILKGITREEQILDGKLSRYYVKEEKELFSDEEMDQRDNVILLQQLFKMFIGSVIPCICGLTRVIKPKTAVALFVFNPIAVYAAITIQYNNNPSAFLGPDFRSYKKLYARHYQNDVPLKYVDIATSIGDYEHMI